MIAEIVALLMFIGPEIKEHRIQESVNKVVNIGVMELICYIFLMLWLIGVSE